MTVGRAMCAASFALDIRLSVATLSKPEAWGPIVYGFEKPESMRVSKGLRAIAVMLYRARTRTQSPTSSNTTLETSRGGSRLGIWGQV
jgi:hypothetical protein